jgi:hypothetical protein
MHLQQGLLGVGMDPATELEVGGDAPAARLAWGGDGPCNRAWGGDGLLAARPCLVLEQPEQRCARCRGRQTEAASVGMKTASLEITKAAFYALSRCTSCGLSAKSLERVPISGLTECKIRVASAKQPQSHVQLHSNRIRHHAARFPHLAHASDSQMRWTAPRWTVHPLNRPE